MAEVEAGAPGHYQDRPPPLALSIEGREKSRVFFVVLNLPRDNTIRAYE
jgi:hypothetical protein